MNTPPMELQPPIVPEVKDNLAPYLPLIKLGRLPQAEIDRILAQEAEEDPDC